MTASTTPNPTAASPRPSAIVMALTYVVGAAGLIIGFTTINREPPSLTWATLLAVVLDWGLRVEAATFLTFGIYLTGCAVMVATTPKGEHRRDLASLIGIASFGVMLIVLGAMAMNAAA